MRRFVALSDVTESEVKSEPVGFAAFFVNHLNSEMLGDDIRVGIDARHDQSNDVLTREAREKGENASGRQGGESREKKRGGPPLPHLHFYAIRALDRANASIDEIDFKMRSPAAGCSHSFDKSTNESTERIACHRETGETGGLAIDTTIEAMAIALETSPCDATRRVNAKNGTRGKRNGTSGNRNEDPY